MYRHAITIVILPAISRILYGIEKGAYNRSEALVAATIGCRSLWYTVLNYQPPNELSAQDR